MGRESAAFKSSFCCSACSINKFCCSYIIQASYEHMAMTQKFCQPCLALAPIQCAMNLCIVLHELSVALCAERQLGGPTEAAAICNILMELFARTVC